MRSRAGTSLHVRMSIAVGAFVAALACVVAVSSAPARCGPSFTIRSSLATRKVLPHRIRWLGSPNLPASKVSDVAFLIDGKVRWIAYSEPYAYGDLGGGGYLVTSWLTPGRHRFTVRATANNGRRASASSVARVLPAPSPPPALANTRWTRTLTADQLGTTTPAGEWNLQIDRRGWVIDDPRGGANFIDVAYLGPDLLESREGIWTLPWSGNPRKRDGNGWCEDTNVPVRYEWSVYRDSLTLTLVGADGCSSGDPGDSESRVWAGVWTRAG